MDFLKCELKSVKQNAIDNLDNIIIVSRFRKLSLDFRNRNRSRSRSRNRYQRLNPFCNLP